MKAGCGRFSLNVTSSSPFTVTVSRLPYQVLRGLTRSASLALPCSRSQVHLTSRSVNGLPSCHLTPRRSLKVRLVPARVPRPFAREVGNDRLHPALRHALVVHDEVVEDPHHRPLARDRRFFVDRHGGGTVEEEDFQDAAGFLGVRRADRRRRQRHDKTGKKDALHALHVTLHVRDVGCRRHL